VLKWPDGARVVSALRTWAEAMSRTHTELCRVGYFGSYARNESGVGSDLDIIVIVSHTDVAFVSRGAHWDTTDLPVPADVLVYTRAEWEQLERGDRPRPRLVDETRWVFIRPH
jgi:predicted nucleotidyltransferase